MTKTMPFVEPVDIPDKPWGVETLLAQTEQYTLKRLVYEPGHQGALQYHERKDEAFHLAEGEAVVFWAPPVEGSTLRTLRRKRMLPGETFHVPPGTPHKFCAISRCVVYEASTPHFDDRVAVADVYGDPDGKAR